MSQVVLLCGSDLLATFSDINPDGSPLWLPEDRDAILRNGDTAHAIKPLIIIIVGIACVERKGTNTRAVIAEQVGVGTLGSCADGL